MRKGVAMISLPGYKVYTEKVILTKLHIQRHKGMNVRYTWRTLSSWYTYKRGLEKGRTVRDEASEVGRNFKLVL